MYSFNATVLLKLEIVFPSLLPGEIPETIDNLKLR